jgi:hypothetical protein
VVEFGTSSSSTAGKTCACPSSGWSSRGCGRARSSSLTTWSGTTCGPYLDYVRAPENGYESVTFPVDDGMEISCRL